MFTVRVITIVLILCTMLSFGTAVFAASGNQNQREYRPQNYHTNDYMLYQQAIQKTAAMTGSREARQLVNKYGLNITNVTWEDTGRYKGSCVGPNISDMTIQVQNQDPHSQRFNLTCMPVIRYNNFSDKSADISPERFYLLVGNEKKGNLRKITLKEFLSDVPAYLSKPESWKAQKRSLLADRDSHVLVSAQACFLPVPSGRKAEFNPVLFNYQSYKENPAVLTILATSEGTSVTVIDNARDGFSAGGSWGQRLFFNQKGERASLTGERLSDYQKKQKNSTSGTPEKHAVTANGNKGLNMVMLIQVPLKQKPRPRRMANYECEGVMPQCTSCCKSDRSNVEAAVIGHGKVEGPFTEIDNLTIERDDRFPVRVTVQYYKATGNGVISEKDVREIRAQIDKTYSQADYVGSLVVEGMTGRPTEYSGSKVQPADWWQNFWKNYHRHMTPSLLPAL